MMWNFKAMPAFGVGFHIHTTAAWLGIDSLQHPVSCDFLSSQKTIGY